MPDHNISLKLLLDKCFDSTETEVNQNVVHGSGKIQNTRFNILGTVENTDFGIDEAMEMAKHVLTLVESGDRDPILLLTNVTGQKLSMRDEWLGMYAYFGHLLKCLHLARESGNRLITLVYNQAIGGSFIAFGMMSDRIFALKGTELAVMWLEGMSKVTKIDIDILRKISETSPVFAPGVENFQRLGGLHKVLALDEVASELLNCLQEPSLKEDKRAQLGQSYGGRKEAYNIIKTIESL
ncbi:malonate decarboxylase subunit gamma [Legionella birminghamensis]|uniref:Malonate decarboxylase subunit gamma n=1 Tax=Legionella birminghamensis TaxID=28083 RepID=A0A378IIS4_9GAMM|nr:biotin-independent malonate decarboxylase subunit gamma [Legionella birminghamensis]KTC75948.1 malonate decarboxylase subunit gamma [Legionella birminghamensis]STX32074.1 malonate decarboxylase subunit gamma [Legionella birminghamensis]